MQTQAVTDAPSTDATAMRLAQQAKVMDWPLQRQVSQRSALVSGVVNLGVACGQIGVGIFSHSQALVADGFHSLADVIGDLVVLSTARASHHPARL